MDIFRTCAKKPPFMLMMEDQKFDADSVKEVVKNLDDYLWNITSNVVCTICHEIFTDPITTPCSHSFCSSCLKKLLSGVKSIKNSCPLCRNSIKRREANNNHVLKNISKICFGLPAAFREDVMNLSPDLKEISKDLVDGSRISGVYVDKDKEKNNKNVKKQRKTNKKGSRDRVLSPSVVSPSGEETNAKNEECLDLKSISQIELKSRLYVADSPEIEKKLRTVKTIPSKQKVSDWLEKVGKTSDPGSSLSTDNWESRDESVIQGTENRDLERSVMRINFDNSEKTTEITENNVKSIENDPYEFIASQRPHGMKTKRKANRGRKKTLPAFQAVQNFTKDSIKKIYLNKTTDIFDDVCDDNLQKAHKTYSRKSDKTITIGDKTQEMLLRDYGKIMSDSEESKVSESEVAPRRRRRILKLCPDIDSDSSVDKNIKKSKLDSSVVISDFESNSKKSEDENAKTKTWKTTKVQSKYSQSAGWSRVSSSKMDFEATEKSRRPRRKSLDISGGEPSLNSSKKRFTEQSPEYDNISNNDVYVKNLSSNSEPLIGFENPSNEEKKYFKLMVENMEEDLAFETSYNAKEFITENFTYTEENVTAGPPKEITYKTPKSRIIPFALLGKIRKKKRSSILFLKLGRLSPNFKRSRSTVVKLIFPKTIHKNRKVGGVAIETQTDLLSQNKPSKGLETVEHEKFKWEEQKKINVEIQTMESFLQTNTKEAQTSPRVEQKSVTVQTVTDDTNSQVFIECNTPVLKTQENNSKDLYLDSELESQFNKTWITQGKRASQNVKSFSLGNKEPNTVIDVVSNETDVLMQRVVDNINLDLARSKAVSRTPVKQLQQCEESESDIFIEQTPPRNTYKNSSALFKTEKRPVVKSEVSRTAEESFLILSGCQSKISDCVNQSKNYEHYSQEQKEKLFPNSFTRESDENDRNELNIKSGCKILRDEDLSNRKICIVSSGVINGENIEKFVNKFQVEHLSRPRKDMTHLIVGLHENDEDGLVPYCTSKLLYAIAHKKWVVTEAWVETCLKSGAIVAEEPFESVDPAGGNGCSVARLSTDLLLKNCEVYLLGEYKSITKDEFSSLIADCGGTVVRLLNEFSHYSGRVRMILVDDSDVQDNAQIRDLMRKYRTLVLSRDVIIISIQGYKIVNFTPFLIQPVSYEQMIKWGYPSDLVKFDCENETDEESSE